MCRWPGCDLCDRCLRGLPRLAEPLCDRCGAPTSWPVRRCGECTGRRLAFARARAAVAYEQAVRTVVSGWKERGLRALAALAADLVDDAVAKPDVVALTFVPPDGDRSFGRGYNPAESLARELGDRWAIEVVEALARTRSAPRQAGLRFVERRGNVSGVFRPTRRVPTRIALVDDVYTTGATVSAASTELRRVGARHVEVVTFARAIR